MKKDEFKAFRYNIVYSLGEDLTKILNLKEYTKSVDNTFELQIRTIFSEGWHEVEHDLRYKCQSDWYEFDYQSRKLNGVYASLETSEWTMIKIFDDLAYKHYKNKNWSAMLRHKFRLRFIDLNLDPEIIEIFNKNNCAKDFFRINRSSLIANMNKYEFFYPITLSNIIYFANLTEVKSEDIMKITPQLFLSEMAVEDETKPIQVYEEVT